jgi:hypothetical protein
LACCGRPKTAENLFRGMKVETLTKITEAGVGDICCQQRRLVRRPDMFELLLKQSSWVDGHARWLE